MAFDNQNDGIIFESLDLPYNKVERELSEKPRLVDGLNSLITLGGKLVKRPGTQKVNFTDSTFRPYRMWLYETLDGAIYVMACVLNPDDNRYKLQYNRLNGTTPGWTDIPNVRHVNQAVYPHECVVARGLFFIRYVPAPAYGEKLGSVIFDGSDSLASPRTTYWGLLGPTQPARFVGFTSQTTAAVSATATTIPVTSTTGSPAAPFPLRLGEKEWVTVTTVNPTDYVVTRGTNGVQTSHDTLTTVAAPDFDDSDHKVEVKVGYQYSYSWKTLTGHISNRVDVERNPDLTSSSTGPFTNKIPKVTVRGHADTTNVPTIVVWRTTDGGGTFLKLKEIDNPGDSDVTFEDNVLASGPSSSTEADPQPDAELSASNPAPSTISNSPPPSVTEPDIIGVAAPVRSTRLAYYAGRIFFAIDNILFYSGNEEIIEGVPEECFPSGLGGNFFRFQHTITSLESTTDALYIFTLEETHQLTGTTKETLNPRLLFNGTGAPTQQPRAITKLRNSLAWLTQDFRIAVTDGGDLTIISDPLLQDIDDIINDQGAQIFMSYAAALEKEWLIIDAVVANNPINSRQWVYDIKKSQLLKEHFWNAPWDIRSTCSVWGRISEAEFKTRLCFFVYTGLTDENQGGHVVSLDLTGNTAYDDKPLDPQASYDFNITTNLFLVPSGNHVNKLRVPGLLPVFEQVQLERIKFPEDSDTRLFYCLDNLWLKFHEVIPLENPAMREQIEPGYITKIAHINKAAKRVALRLVANKTKYNIEIQNLNLIWRPESGAKE